MSTAVFIGLSIHHYRTSHVLMTFGIISAIFIVIFHIWKPKDVAMLQGFYRQ